MVQDEQRVPNLTENIIQYFAKQSTTETGAKAKAKQEQNRSKAEAKQKQSRSKTEAKQEQSRSKAEAKREQSKSRANQDKFAFPRFFRLCFDCVSFSFIFIPAFSD